jgi:hypothetical protein
MVLRIPVDGASRERFWQVFFCAIEITSCCIKNALRVPGADSENAVEKDYHSCLLDFPACI